MSLKSIRPKQQIIQAVEDMKITPVESAVVNYIAAREALAEAKEQLEEEEHALILAIGRSDVPFVKMLGKTFRVMTADPKTTIKVT